MAITTKDVSFDNLRDADEAILTLKDATTFYKNSFCAMSSTGVLKPFDGTSGDVLLGRLVRADNGGFTSTGVTYAGKGDNSLTTFGGISGRPTGTVKLGGETISRATITGVAAASDMGKPVYLNADDQTFTLTAPATNSQQLGVVGTWASGATADLIVLPFSTRQAINSDQNDYWMHIATVNAGTGSALTVAASVFGIIQTAAHHGQIIDCFAMNNGAALTGGPVTVNPAINGVSTTGGNMVLTAALAAKTKVAGTSITAANEFHKGDTLDLITSTVTNITAGQVDFFIKIHRLQGA